MKRQNPFKYAVLFTLLLTPFISSTAISESHQTGSASETKALEAINTILITLDEQRVNSALMTLDKHWRVEYIANALEAIAYTQRPRSQQRVIELLLK